MIDVVVVGAGAGGLAACYKLSSRGLKVVCIEQGPDRLEENMLGMLKGGELQKFGSYSSLPRARGGVGAYPIDCRDSPIEVHNYCGLGGSTMLFSAQYPRLHASDFKPIWVDGRKIEWPLGLDDLSSFYNENESLVGLRGLEGDPYNPGVCPSGGPVPLGRMGHLLARGFDTLGWNWWPAYSAISVDAGQLCRPLRPTNIDTSRNKGTAKRAYYQTCLENGVEFRTATCVTHLVCDSSDSSVVKGVAYRDLDGNEDAIQSRYVVLSAGGIGTPRIMLNTRVPGSTNGIGNRNGLVGKGLMMHPWGYADGLFEENIDSMNGPQGCCLLSQHHYSFNKDRVECGGFTLQALRGPWPYEGAKSWLSRKKITISNSLYRDYRKIHNHSAHFAVIVDDEPIHSNMMTLDKSVVDAYGMPGVRVQYEMSDRSKQKLAAGLKAARKVLQAAGATKTWGYGPVRETGWHTLGTCSMGVNEDTSVTDREGKVHGVANLFIADGSLLSRGGSVNPANTIQTLGLYVGSLIGRS